MIPQHFLLVFITAIIVGSCGGEEIRHTGETVMKPEKPQAEIHETAPAATTKKNKKEAVVIVKNPADYSEAFLAGLHESTGFRKFDLRDSLFIINDQDTVLFPTSIKIGDAIKFTGRKDELAIALTVKRINYTTVSYSLEMVEFGKASHNQKGTADLASGFFLGSESDEENGELYMVDEFMDHGKDDCLLKIRIGEDPSGGNTLVCKIIKNCNGKLRNITLNNFPALQEK